MDRLRALVLLLTVVTGFTGLVYEVTWQRYLAILLGSQSEATAIVLGLFLSGLSLGYALFGRVARWGVERGFGRRAWLAGYGAVEAAVGVTALAFPFSFDLARGVSIALPVGGRFFGFAFDVGLSAALILPPAVLMGATIPILTQALSRDLADSTRIHARIYATNTLGAFLGAAAAGFVLIPALGLRDVLLWTGATNLLAGASFAALGRSAGGPVGSAAQPSVVSRFGLYAVVALLGGFAMMSLQVVLMRVGALALGPSQFTFASVVAIFVLCIALGSLVVGALPRIPAWAIVVSQWALVGSLFGLYFGVDTAPYWAHVLRSSFESSAENFRNFHLAALFALLGVLVVPIGLSGATLPLLFHHLRREAGDLGKVAGRLYAWNTVGSLLGALLGGYALLFWLDLHEVYRVAVGALALAAGLLTRLVLPRTPRLGVAAALAACALGLALPGGWDPLRLSSGTFRLREPVSITGLGPDAFFATYREQVDVRFHVDDPVASVAVWERVDDGTRSVIVNGKTDGSLGPDYPTMALAALLPALFADDCARGFVIGFGTGVTAGELAALDCSERVVVAEISDGVISAARWFESGNQGATANPKVVIERADAYRSLVRSRERFDLIVSEPSNPWVAGVEMLLSREFLETARDHLEPGGVYAQWFHLYETDTETVELVLRTYAAVFEHIAIWGTVRSDVLLLGFDSEARALDLQRLSERAGEPDFRAGLRRAGVHSLPELLAHELVPVGVVHAADLPGPLHTLLHPLLSDHAGRAFFRGGRAELPALVHAEPAQVGIRNSLLRRLALDRGGQLPDAERANAIAELCFLSPPRCAAGIAEWTREAPGSPILARLLAAMRTNPALRRALEPRILDRVGALLPGAPALPAGARAAERASQLFASHFSYVAPFDRAILDAAWARCSPTRGEPADACAAGRRAAEALLGPLDAGAPSGRPSRTPS